MICEVKSQGSHGCLLERAVINFQALGQLFQALGNRKIPQEDHTGTCLKVLSLTFKLLVIEKPLKRITQALV